MKVLIISLVVFLCSQTSDTFAFEDIFQSLHRNPSPSPSPNPSPSPSPESYQKGEATFSSSAEAEGHGDTASATASTTGEVASGKKPKKQQKKTMSTKGFLGSKSARHARKKARKTHKKMSGGKSPKNATLTESTTTKTGGYEGKTDTKTMESWLEELTDDDDFGLKTEIEGEVEGPAV